MRRALYLCLCLCVLLFALSAPVAATSSEDEPNMLKNKVEQFIKEKGLTEEDFAVYFYNPATREEYAYNENAFLPVGNNWILPLHMHYYEQETLGAYNPPPEDPDAIYMIGGLTLEKCRYRSIIMGEEEIARQMRDNLGSPENYLILINDEYGHIETEELPDSYFLNNCYSATFLMNCLKRVSTYPELYQDMMKNFSLVQTDDGFAAYDRPYSLVHLRGEQDDFICDLAEVSAPDTYLLVCFASEDAGGDTLLAEVNSLFCNHVEQTYNIEQNAETTGDGDRLRSDTDFDVASLNNNARHKRALYIWIGVGLAAGGVVAGIIGLIWRAVVKHDDKKWEERKIKHWDKED